MDIQTIRGLGTVVVMVAFIGLALWVFNSRRKPDFDEATLLPFADDPEAIARVERQQQEKNSRRNQP
ncbi:cbb3-type cytochrome c oxidase subunit 3 [Pseudomonas capeferrum]|uniref:cbb3-type cytochrome oxidase subunit 3 n=1 Tax=Pseudomonas capeferrum TaxID=1495066 RepID=UPI0015E32637|nr:cbb3-type cytochrome c oxidase subunit 3 [Pseudomonas capeferrum]MBA1200382.1 cbb3-type cytochrome c oxidase subunit 3 [Pseudomonas capeferrum]